MSILRIRLNTYHAWMIFGNFSLFSFGGRKKLSLLSHIENFRTLSCFLIVSGYLFSVLIDGFEFGKDLDKL